jgi:hypothetical protein
MIIYNLKIIELITRVGGRYTTAFLNYGKVKSDKKSEGENEEEREREQRGQGGRS